MNSTEYLEEVEPIILGLKEIDKNIAGLVKAYSDAACAKVDGTGTMEETCAAQKAIPEFALWMPSDLVILLSTFLKLTRDFLNSNKGVR